MAPKQTNLIADRTSACDASRIAAIDAVLQHEIKGAAGELLAATSCSIRQYPPLAPDSGFF
jgi:hypothetical protein